MRYAVRYTDGRRPAAERGVRFARLRLDRMRPEIQRKNTLVDATTRHLVTELSQVLETTMYMRSDVVVSREGSHNDVLYLVKAGTVSLFGRDIAHPFFVESVRDKQCFGDDIAMLVTADRPKRLRWYTAKAQEVTQVHVLRAEPFQAILDQPKFAHFRRHIRVYGTWIAVKVKLVELAMEKRLRVIYAGGAPDDGAAAAAGPPPPLDRAAVARTLDGLAAQIADLRALLLADRPPDAPPTPPPPPGEARSPPKPPPPPPSEARSRRSSVSTAARTASSKSLASPSPERPSPERRPSRPSVVEPDYASYVRPLINERSPRSPTTAPEEARPLFDAEIEASRRRPANLLRADDPRGTDDLRDFDDFTFG